MVRIRLPPAVSHANFCIAPLARPDLDAGRAATDGTSSATAPNSTSTSEPNHTASTAPTSTSRSTTRRARLNRHGGTTMKLYNHSQAPNPRRVRIFVAEKGINLPMEEIDLMAGKNRTPEFLAKNPSGGLPVLELDDGGCIAESVAICRYLEGQHPEPNPDGPQPARAGRDRDVEPAHGAGAVRVDRPDHLQHPPDVQGTTAAIPRIRRGA